MEQKAAVRLKREPDQSLQCCSVDFVFINDRKSYIPLAKKSIEHIFASRLTSLGKLFFFLVDLYAHLNESKEGLREIEKSGREWANLLGCSEEWVFQMQKKLEDAGYFQIIREKDEDNQNEKNIIIPTLPDDVFAELSKEPNRKGKEYSVFMVNNHEGCKRSYLDDSKMFIMFNLKMIKLLLADDLLSSLQKLIWLHFFCRSHIAYTDSLGDGTRNFITTYKEVAELFACSEKAVSTAIINLAELGYISKKQFRAKEQGKTSRRKKKSCWEIAALFPQDKMEILLQQPDRQNIAPLTNEDLRLYDLNQGLNQNTSVVSNVSDSSVRSGAPSVTKGGFSETSQYYIKDHISKSYLNKNTDQLATPVDKITTVNNVFIEQKLTASSEEVSLGLTIAENFDNQTAVLAKEMPYEQAIKQADLAITTIDHWLVTKVAFMLQKKYNAAFDAYQKNFVSNMGDEWQVKAELEPMFTPAEIRLISLWESFSDVADVAEEQEFLLRKSWFLKLLPPATTAVIPIAPQPQTLPELPMEHEIVALPIDKKDKARKFAHSLRERGLAQGYAAEIGIEELALEFIYHAANWVPERLNCKTREEQIDAALSFAWRAAEQGRWKCPYQLLNAQIQQREQEAARWKQW